MNQILDYTPNGNPNKSGDSDKIVRVFAIILIIFAVALIAVVASNLISNRTSSNSTAEVEYANIEVEVEDTQATIKVTHTKAIQKLIYSWNDSTERTVTETEKYVEETVDVPAGDNTLHIKVIDSDGIESTHDEEISSEQGVDIINPVIELAVTEDKKLKIVATDETVLDFITYRWNEDEEQTVYAEENGKEIETEIEILRGENDLTVVAVDGSSNTTTETKSFTGLVKPEITVTLSEDGSSINIKATHEKGIESVAYNFNNTDYQVDIGDGKPKEIEFPQKLEVGYNRIILTVKSIDGTETTFDGECSYGEEGSGSNSSSNNESNNNNSSNSEENNE